MTSPKDPKLPQSKQPSRIRIFLKRATAGLGMLLLVALLILQFFPPEIEAEPVAAEMDFLEMHQARDPYRALVRDACYDCHSHILRMPWYGRIQPVGHYLADHIREGRDALNFSTFGDLRSRRARSALYNSAEVVREAEMPLREYTWLHPKARLDPEQREALAAWFESLAQ